MTQVFAEDGALVPVISSRPVPASGPEDDQKDGYDAVQIGLVEGLEPPHHQPDARTLEKAGVQPVKTLAEVP
jgi:hypothetical protein